MESEYFKDVKRAVLTEKEISELAKKKSQLFKQFIDTVLQKPEYRKRIYITWLEKKDKNKSLSKMAEAYGREPAKSINRRLKDTLERSFQFHKAKEDKKAIDVLKKANLAQSMYESLYKEGEDQEVDAIYKEYIAVRNKLVAGNLRLVFSFSSKFTAFGIPLDDLVQEGNLGLIRAVEKFDPERGFKFSTYAGWWIRQFLQRIVKEYSAHIRVPPHAHEEIRRLRKFRKKYREEYKREPSYSAIENELGYDRQKVNIILDAENKYISLDTPSYREGDTLKDTISCDAHENVFHRMEGAQLRGLMDKHLTDLEKYVLYHKFGFPEAASMPRRNIDPNCFRNLENRALSKLKKATIQ